MSDEMGMERLIAQLRALEAKATKGRWYLLETPWLAHGLETMILAGSPDPHVGRAVCDFQCQEQEQGDDPESNGWNDADFIVALRNALPELLAHCSRLKAERDAAMELAEIGAFAVIARLYIPRCVGTQALTEAIDRRERALPSKT